jgi:hypothetical protein
MTYRRKPMYTRNIAEGSEVNFIVEGRFDRPPHAGYLHGIVLGKTAVIPDDRPDGEAVALGDHVYGFVKKDLGSMVYVTVTKNNGCAAGKMIGQLARVPITGLWFRDARYCISDPGLKGGIKGAQVVIDDCKVSRGKICPRIKHGFIQETVLIRSVEKEGKEKNVVRSSLADPRSPHRRNREEDLFIGELDYEETLDGSRYPMRIFNGIPDGQKRILMVTGDSARIMTADGEYLDTIHDEPENAISKYLKMISLKDEMPLVLTNNLFLSQIYFDAAQKIGLIPETLLRKGDL